ncbi:aspartyl/asparaginyl beta-hydroxylase-like isoform X1 [Daphnia carinata]|uniref:aspartyl/asparaginyl beta-hydroxylase-like isoform X1 n=1 Tax=Daphnia carinata TaxID=120202 RepID=UPI00257E79B0|nr:aspartyl/asparaginyl beta-hydroxylase-like isoform X1 [Daphnia carinata]
MSADLTKKRKDKRKKKAILEALQQEEYQEERAHVQQLDETEADFVVHPTDDSEDTVPLLEESDGSGACAKIIFLVLLSSLGLAVGVIFFEMGGIETFTRLADPVTNAPPVKYEPAAPAVDVAYEDDFDRIDPSPMEPESFKENTISMVDEPVEIAKDLPSEVPETVPIAEVPEDIIREIETEIVEEPKIEAAESVPEPVEELPEATNEIVEETVQASENFETQLEDEPAEVPEESFTMRAEREAVQAAVDEVWVMTVRCIEELRALQVMAKSSLTHAVIDTISQRLEPLRSQLDELVKNTSDSVFDGALEQAAELERNLRAVLEELDEARNQDTILAQEAAQQEAAQLAEDPEEVQAEEEIVSEEEALDEPEIEVAREANVETLAEELEVEPQVETEPQEVLKSDADFELPQVESLLEQEVIPEPQVDDLPERQEETESKAALPVEHVVEPIVESIPVPEPFVESVPESHVEVVPEPAVDSWIEPVEDTVSETQPLPESQVEAVAEPEIADVPVPEVIESELKEETVIAVEPELEISDVQADQPIVQVEEVAETNDVAEEIIPVPQTAEVVDAPVAEDVSSDETQSEAEHRFDSVVEEPVQVATEAFLVEEEQSAAPVTNVPSRMQNLEEADRLVDQSPAQALALMEQILEKDPHNALALYGRARSLDSLAEVERSNARLEQSIFAYRAVLDLEHQVDDQLYHKSALRCIDRMRFRGFHGKAIRIQQRLVARFPNDIEYQNQLAVGFLLTNQPEAARTILEGVLERWPQSGFAQVHLGFILKTTYNDYDAGARWMMAGIASREEGVIDGRFYSHLGDSLTRLGKHEEAQRIYADGEKEGVFRSHDQRSLYNVDRLTAQPWWDKEATTYGPFFDLLEANWRQIRNEGVALLTLESPEGFANESEKLRDSGDWKQFELFGQGRKNAAHCNQAPVTCTLIENYPPALCKRGQVKFSIMHPGTHVWSHTGPTNCRLRAHLGLVVPDGAKLRVGNTIKSWEEGKFVVFDDSFDHEVWHNGSSYRLVLIVDLWHPELTTDEWQSLAPI